MVIANGIERKAVVNAGKESTIRSFKYRLKKNSEKAMIYWDIQN
jgi:hypothetical protein